LRAMQIQQEEEATGLLHMTVISLPRVYSWKHHTWRFANVLGR